MLDFKQWHEDHIVLAEIIAARIGTELEEDLLRSEVGRASAERERGRLGRDLHDGVLQGLAAASIQLKIASDQLPPQARLQMKAIRSLLSAEAQRIRGFVEESRAVSSTSGVVPYLPLNELSRARPQTQSGSAR